MWTETTQQQYRRDGLRYASDVTHEEWALIEALLPPPRKLGRPRTTEMREDTRVIETASRVRLAAACPEAALFRHIAAALMPAGP
jgi:transposase